MRNKSDQAPPLYLPIGDQTWIFMPPSNDSVLVATASRASFPMISTTNPPSSASSSEMGQKQTKTASSFVRQAVGAAGVVVTDRSRNGNPEQKRCKTRGSFPPAPHRVDYLLDLQPVDKQTREEHSWNPNDRSLNVFIKEDDPTTIHRHPVAQSTDCARGRRGYSGGIHAWEFQWNTRQRGTHAVVGVAEITAPIHAYGYSSVVGSSPDSWGWDINKKKLYHADSNNNSTNPYPFKDNVDEKEDITVPESFKMILDMDAGTLAFVVDGEYLGVAFQGLKGKTLYPIVNVVWGHAEVTCRYLGGIAPEPLPLMALCRRTIRKRIGEDNIKDVHSLPLPTTIQNYLIN